MKWVAYIIGTLTTAGAAVYLAVYLYRWEWQRAVLAGVLLIVVEVFLACVVVIDRISRLEQRISASERRSDTVRQRLDQSAQLPDPTFRWLDGDGRLPWSGSSNSTYVFIPVLLATGALLSALAWVVQRIATVVVRPAANRRLSGRLAPLAAPPQGIAGRPADLEDGPALGGSPRRVWFTATVSLIVGTLLAGMVVALAGATQTRPQERPDEAATTFLLQLAVRDANPDQERRELRAQQLWESCRGATPTPLKNAPLSHVEGNVYAGVVSPALTDHNKMRLRGCLVDVQIDRAHFTLVGEGDIDHR
ncbi:hypothetical protein [Streptomyces sp. KR80]|uniref:hypothetical protein n=1 Tax=Streptomyces sp. KR80 TaxID=3457426 RepID=UPI003FD59A71